MVLCRAGAERSAMLSKLSSRSRVSRLGVEPHLWRTTRRNYAASLSLPDSMRVAAMSDDNEAMLAWLSAHPDMVDARHSMFGETMLVLAAARGHVGTVGKLLSDFHADVNLATTRTCCEADGVGCCVTAVMAAAAAGHKDVVTRLIDAGARVTGVSDVLNAVRSDGQLSDVQHEELMHCCACCTHGCACCNSACHCCEGECN